MSGTYTTIAFDDKTGEIKEDGIVNITPVTEENRDILEKVVEQIVAKLGREITGKNKHMSGYVCANCGSSGKVGETNGYMDLCDVLSETPFEVSFAADGSFRIVWDDEGWADQFNKLKFIKQMKKRMSEKPAAAPEGDEPDTLQVGNCVLQCCKCGDEEFVKKVG